MRSFWACPVAAYPSASNWHSAYRCPWTSSASANSAFQGMIAEEGIFSIITTYLRLAAQGEKIAAFRADDSYWRDLGNAESLQQAAEDLR